MSNLLELPARPLFPANYVSEPRNLPGLKLVWIEATAEYAIVRFYTDGSGDTVMFSIDRQKTRDAAQQRLARLKSELGAGLRQPAAGIPPIWSSRHAASAVA